jgi:hypothetical protein
MTSSLLLAGAHRGGESFSRAGTAALRNRIADVLVADPVADRANALATYWRNAGLLARARAEPAEAIVKRFGWPEGIAFAAIDKPAAIAKVLALGCMIPVRWQILGRASGDDAPVLAFAGTVLPSNKALRGEAVALLRRLAMAVPEQSSRAVWDSSAFHQDALTALRGKVSARSVQEVVSLEERRLAVGKLELFWGTESSRCRWSGWRTTTPITKRCGPAGARSLWRSRQRAIVTWRSRCFPAEYEAVPRWCSSL